MTIESQPSFAPYYIRLAELCLQLGHWEEACRAAVRALQLTDLEPYNDLLLRRAAAQIGGNGADLHASARAEERRLGLRLARFGFTDSALAALETKAADPGALWLQALACRQLALWHYRQATPDGFAAAATWAARGTAAALLREHRDSCRILESLALLKCGKTDEAGSCLHGCKESESYITDLLLCLANVEPTAKAKLINRALARHGLSPITFADSVDADCLYDRLGSAEFIKTKPRGEMPLITVIVAAFKATTTLPTALRSLQDQTWQNLEILVVDDASTDRTAEIVTGFAASDPRIRLISMRENGGAYVARNRGLEEARGEFVTTHDADDWSHPDKLRIQAECLVSEPDLVACASQQARATAEMIFERPDNEGHLVTLNASSLMFRRDVFRSKCGGWDPVRFAADSEVFERLARATSPAAICKMSTGPLSFQRSSDASIVNDSHWGFDGYQFGARDVYMETYRAHHRNGGALIYSPESGRRFFPVPRPLQPGARKGEAKRRFDTILVADFRQDTAAARACVADWRRLRKTDQQCAILHLYADRDVPPGSFLSVFREEPDFPDLEILVYGEKAECKTVVFHNAQVLQQPQRYWPEITAKSARLVVHESLPKEALARAGACVTDALGLPLTLVPASAAIRKLLPDLGPHDSFALASDDWTGAVPLSPLAPVTTSSRGPKSVLFLLPVRGGNGGANSVVQEAAALRLLGLDARVAVNRKDFDEYFDLYADVPALSDILTAFDPAQRGLVGGTADVVVATLFSSVAHVAALRDKHPQITPAYYIQDYEPWFHATGTDLHRRAFASYTQIPDLVCFAKTNWLCDLVRQHHGIEVKKVQASIDHSVFRPALKKSDGKVHVVAMVRPSTPRRGAARTIRVLQQLHQHLADAISLHIFGCLETDPGFVPLERGFPHTNHGPLTRKAVAELLGACHVFLDASDYQAFGRTALEAMACRCASVVPAAGGTSEYAIHGENALVVDTASEAEILRQMTELLQNSATIDTLAEAGHRTALRYSTEGAAESIAKALGLLI
jgi:glycosyltransferase involved in cell wall biosynthesis